MRLLKTLFKKHLAEKENVSQPNKQEPEATKQQQVESLIALGQSQEDAGKLELALASFRKALEIDPHYSRTYLNIGNVLESLGNIADAEANYRLAIKNDTQSGGAYANLGRIKLEAHAYLEAVELYSKAVHLIPGQAGLEAQLGLAFALSRVDQHLQAIEAYEKALSYDPFNEKATLALAHIFISVHRLDDAADLLEKFLSRNPEHGEATGMLGEDYVRQGMSREGFSLIEKACSLEPKNDFLAGMKLFTSNYIPDINPEQLFEEHLSYAERFFSEYYPQSLIFENDRDPQRKLKIGYVSADFKRHPVSVFVEPLLEHHDRSAFEVHAWHVSSSNDHVTQRIRGLVDVWHDVHALDDDELAQSIRGTGIDILIDLSGLTGGNKLFVFARKPAPIQATWLGYLGTTGLKTMDYRICDCFTDPPGMTEAYHTETLARLPSCQWCHAPYRNLAEIPPAPVLENGYLTLGSFNNTAKLNDDVLNLWTGVLKAVPDARLHLADVKKGRAQKRILRRMESKGIDTSRLHFIPRLEYADYLKNFATVDIALDPFPYNGGTTSIDTLVMGVPFVTLAGRHSIARGGVSLLSNAGLSNFIAESPEEYISTIKYYADHPEMLAAIRTNLRQKVESSAIMDSEFFVRDFEQMCHQWWERWCGSPVLTP